MNVLIIDDEPPARAELRRLLAGYPDIEVLGECANAIERSEEHTSELQSH